MLIFPLRGHFPLVAGKTPEGDGPTELVGGRNVVDGLALRRAWNDQASPFAGPSDLPSPSSAQTILKVPPWCRTARLRTCVRT